MSTKLTLVMDRDVISSAKTYARARGTSVSKLVESLLATMSSGDEGTRLPTKRRGSLTASLTGAIPLHPEDRGKTAKELIGEARQERYL